MAQRSRVISSESENVTKYPLSPCSWYHSHQKHLSTRNEPHHHFAILGMTMVFALRGQHWMVLGKLLTFYKSIATHLEIRHYWNLINCYLDIGINPQHWMLLESHLTYIVSKMISRSSYLKSVSTFPHELNLVPPVPKKPWHPASPSSGVSHFLRTAAEYLSMLLFMLQRWAMIAFILSLIVWWPKVSPPPRAHFHAFQSFELLPVGVLNLDLRSLNRPLIM